MKTKSILKVAILCLAMSAGSIPFTACSNEDDSTEKVANEIETINIKYSVHLTEDWYKFFNIEVRYSCGADEQTITLTKDWDFKTSIPYSSRLKNYTCTVTAQPKTNTPIIASGTTYVLGHDINANVSGTMKDGSTSADFLKFYSTSSIKSISAINMGIYITSEHKLSDFSYTAKSEN